MPRILSDNFLLFSYQAADWRYSFSAVHLTPSVPLSMKDREGEALMWICDWEDSLYAFTATAEYTIGILSPRCLMRYFLSAIFSVWLKQL